MLRDRVADAVQHHEHLTAERQLLEDTLSGAIKALNELLALTCPVAAGRAMRLSRYSCDLATELHVDRWEIEMTALLSQIGCATIAPEVAERICRGAVLSPAEEEIAAQLPLIAERVLAAIPRLDGVRTALRRMRPPDAGTGALDAPPLASRILRIVWDLDVAESRGEPVPQIIARFAAASEIYDPKIVAALHNLAHFIGTDIETQDLPLSDVEKGMVFAGDVFSPLGILLIARGQDVTAGIQERIRQHWAPFADRTVVRIARMRSA
jgi:hypothetical protein